MEMLSQSDNSTEIHHMSAFTTNLSCNAEIISLEQAHWRLLGYLALVAGGFIREDAPVEVLVYDFDALLLDGKEAGT